MRDRVEAVINAKGVPHGPEVGCYLIYWLQLYTYPSVPYRTVEHLPPPLADHAVVQ